MPNSCFAYETLNTLEPVVISDVTGLRKSTACFCRGLWLKLLVGLLHVMWGLWRELRSYHLNNHQQSQDKIYTGSFFMHLVCRSLDQM